MRWQLYAFLWSVMVTVGVMFASFVLTPCFFWISWILQNALIPSPDSYMAVSLRVTKLRACKELSTAGFKNTPGLAAEGECFLL